MIGLMNKTVRAAFSNSKEAKAFQGPEVAGKRGETFFFTMLQLISTPTGLVLAT